MVVLDLEVIEVVEFCLLPMGCKLLKFEVQIEDLFLRIKPYLIRLLCLVWIMEAQETYSQLPSLSVPVGAVLGSPESDLRPFNPKCCLKSFFANSHFATGTPQAICGPAG